MPGTSSQDLAAQLLEVVRQQEQVTGGVRDELQAARARIVMLEDLTDDLKRHIVGEDTRRLRLRVAHSRALCRQWRLFSLLLLREQQVRALLEPCVVNGVWSLCSCCASSR